MKSQLSMTGDMEVNTRDPILQVDTVDFVKMFKAGLVYEKKCRSTGALPCKTGLAMRK